MLLRRSAIIRASGVLFAAAPWLMRRGRAQSPQQAVDFVRTTAGNLVAIVNNADTQNEKRQKLRQVIEAAVDVNDIAVFCLGRFWRIATAEQQKQYLGLFGDLLVTKIAGHLGEYQGVQVTIGLARTAADTEIVISEVERPNMPIYQVDWVVSTATGLPRIVDLLAGGTSLRLTQSSDFAAYLARHQYNIHDLIDAMQQLIAQNG